jgi:hypothetical protein
MLIQPARPCIKQFNCRSRSSSGVPARSQGSRTRFVRPTALMVCTSCRKPWMLRIDQSRLGLTNHLSCQAGQAGLKRLTAQLNRCASCSFEATVTATTPKLCLLSSVLGRLTPKVQPAHLTQHQVQTIACAHQNKELSILTSILMLQPSSQNNKRAC